MRKGLVAILFLVCGVLLAGNVVAYVGEDHSGPEISILEEAVTYVAGTDTSLLLTGVTATDERDGDVTDTVTIESVIPNTDGTEASVIYVAKDSKNNVTKETRKVSYTTDAAAAVQAAAWGETGQSDAAGEPAADTEGQSRDAAAAEGQGADATSAEGQSVDSQGADDGQAQNEAAIAALPADSPRLYLTQYSVEIERGAEFNRLSYVQDITDDQDSREELYRGIQISGEVDTNTPGEYILEYYVSDSDGNNSNTAQLRVTVR